MTPVRLVRHGQASAGWGIDPDPDLDDLGRSQAEAVAARLDDLVGEATPEVWTSPLLRCRNTAEPFRQRRGANALVEEAVREIPSPLGMATSERADWLRSAMDGTWSDLGGEFVAFRDRLVERIAAIEHDTVVFSHFIAINAIIGACNGDDRLVIRTLDNTSITTVDITDGILTLVEGGAEADTIIR